MLECTLLKSGQLALNRTLGGMNLEHSFEIAVEPNLAWETLLDVPRIAPCLPGAELTETVDPQNFKGFARVKLGPVNLQFAGNAQIKEIDHRNHRARVIAKGKDAKGRGSANAEIVFNLTGAGDGRTRVNLETDLALTGSVAQYGRATGLIDEIARQLISDFARNLEAELATGKNKNAEHSHNEPSLHEVLEKEPASTTDMKDADSPNAVSGFSLLVRSLWAMFKRLFSGQ